MHFLSDLNSCFFVINSLLGLIRQGPNLSELSVKRRPFNFRIASIIILSCVYVIFLARNLIELKFYGAKSQLYWVVPTMVHYGVKTINGEVQRKLFLEIVEWMKKTFEETHPVGIVQNNVSLMNSKCLQKANLIFGLSLVLFLGSGFIYITQWICLHDDDPLIMYLIPKTAVKLLSCSVVFCIMLGYNLFLYLGVLVIIYRLKTVSSILQELQRKSDELIITERARWRRRVLIQCHSMHVDVAFWTRKFVKFHRVVCLIDLLIFFLNLFVPLFWNPGFVFTVGFFQMFAVCVFGEMIAVENDTIRRNLYCHLDWCEFDRENQRLVLWMIAGCSPDSTIVIINTFKLRVASVAKFVVGLYLYLTILHRIWMSKYGNYWELDYEDYDYDYDGVEF